MSVHQKEVLSVPNLPSIYAVFEKLEIKGEPKPNVLEYSFVFREVMEKKQKTVIYMLVECMWTLLACSKDYVPLHKDVATVFVNVPTT